MNPADRQEFTGLIESAVAPTLKAAQDAANAAAAAHKVAKEIRLEINGGPGYKGVKERLGVLETRCTINHDPDNTQRREAITEQQRIDAMKRALRNDSDGHSLAPRSRRHRWLDSTTARTIGIVLGAMIGTAAATYAITMAAESPPAQAAPMHNR